ncbi:MAG TPA: PQQ-dependent dehydrogenase, methanol/ethanol family [Dongiaceae bacterium]|nr:PQQ-dependent dehydrogenase, methanol/ethanol family [Dongiaceae bacterium]
MKPLSARWFSPCALAAFALSAFSALAQTAQQGNATVTAQDLLAQPVGENWTSYNGDYTAQRFSRLRQINVENAATLQAAWVFHPGNSQTLEVTPVVVRGVMFVTSANDVFALDARTGRELWHFSRPVSSGLLDDAAAHKNRGVAVRREAIFVETDDAHLLKLDARSGNLIWDVPYADKAKHYGATSAPLVVKDMVIVGTSGGDSGVRGFLEAYDAATGKLKWHLWTIPGPGEFGSSSWPGDSYLHGGGTTWMPGSYDPALNTLYWATSNAAPDFVGDSRPGDDLYTSCVLAIDPDTGTLKWHFQFTPHDLYDYDATQASVLIDAKEKNTMRHLLAHADRNGFFYVLDRTDGKFLRASPFVEKLTWAKSIDATGRPVLSGLVPSPDGTTICPGIEGATNWFSPSYNPDTGLFYVLALEGCNLFRTKSEPFVQGQTFYNTGTTEVPGERRQKLLLALNLADGKIVWSYPQVGRGRSWGGTLTTAGGLVFFCNDAEGFEAVDATSGRPLWHFNTGQNFHASPMTYAVAGEQFVAIAAGGDVFAFSLPGSRPR